MVPIENIQEFRSDGSCNVSFCTSLHGSLQSGRSGRSKEPLAGPGPFKRSGHFLWRSIFGKAQKQLVCHKLLKCCGNLQDKFQLLQYSSSIIRNTHLRPDQEPHTLHIFHEAWWQCIRTNRKLLQMWSDSWSTSSRTNLKSFSLRFLVSGKRTSITVAKNFWCFGEFTEKLNNWWQESISVLNWIYFASMAYNKVDRMKAATLILCLGAYLASWAWTFFLSALIDTVVSYAWPRQLLISIVCFCKLFLIAVAIAEPVVLGCPNNTWKKLSVFTFLNSATKLSTDSVGSLQKQLKWQTWNQNKWISTY